MKLKYNNFLIIVPLFFFLGITLAFFNYSLEKKELLWGIESELDSLSKASSIFISNSEDQEKIKNSLMKIIKYDRVHSFLLIEDNKVIMNVSSDKIKHTILDYQKDINISSDLVYQSDIYEKEKFHFIDGYIKVKNSNLTLMTSLEVGTIVRSLEQEYKNAFLTILVISIIGILVSILISIIVTSKIKEVSDMADALNKGDFNEDFRFSKVIEFADLGLTLDIMKSIISEMQFKTKNSIIQENLFLSKSSFLKRDTLVSLRLNTIVTKDISLLVNHGEIENTFYHCLESNRFTYAYCGQLEKVENDFDTLVSLASVSYYLDKLLQENNTIDLNSILEEYSLVSLVLVRIDKQTREVMIQKINAETITLDISDKEMHLIHASHQRENPVEEQMKNYISKYPNLSISEMRSDLELLFTDNVLSILIQAEESKA
jgi:hypothetical protein